MGSLRNLQTAHQDAGPEKVELRLPKAARQTRDAHKKIFPLHDVRVEVRQNEARRNRLKTFLLVGRKAQP